MSQATRILLALVFGLVVGIAAASASPDWAIAATKVTGPIGSAWLHGLQMVIVPLIVGLAGDGRRRDGGCRARRADRGAIGA